MALEGYEGYHQFIDKLTENNVDKYIDLPMIAVMGDTSSGKSSLLSNISLVELPSADKLTTRCPIMLKMQPAASRSARVKISWKDTPNDEAADFAERTIAEEDWDSITGAIADAQTHIIKRSGKDVARDIVSVDIEGPHCEKLTLIDLPGIVRTAGKGESKTLAEDIQSLMEDYLANPRCVILAVLPCNVDFHNSQIMADARKVDPSTLRTIPVLTKPDLIDHGGEGGVKELLLGSKTESFSMGFHMVKGRGQAALDDDKSIEEGLNDEESFFRNKEPWRGIEDKNLFGTKNLRIKLARLQMELIRTSLPSIKYELKSKYDESAMLLQQLGTIPSNIEDKRALFRSAVDDIWKGIGSNTLDGPISTLHSDSEMRPSAKFHEASQLFQDALSSSKLANISVVEVGAKVIVVKDNIEFKGEVCLIDKAKGFVYLKEIAIESNVTSTGINNLKKREPGDIFRWNGNVYIEREDNTIDELSQFDLSVTRPDPEWISMLIKKNRPYKLPIFINTHLFEAIVAGEIKKEWTPPTIELLEFTSKAMNAAAEDFVKEMKQISPFPSFQTFLINKAAEVVDSLTRDAMIKVEEYVDLEKVPYTQNHYLFENINKNRLERVMDEVLTVLPKGTSNVTVRPSSLSSTVRNVFQRNQARSVDDHMAEEMLHVLSGYGKVVLKRYIDHVPMTCIKIMQNFAQEMKDVLSNATDEVISRLITASPDVVTKVNQLREKVDTLKKGITALGELM